MTGTYFLIVVFFTLFIGTLTFPFNLDRFSSVSSSDIFREVIGTTDNEDQSSDDAVNNTSRSEDSLDDADSSNSDRTGQEIVTNPPDEEVSIPVADAGQDVTIPGQTLTQLDGSKSYFPSDGVDDVRPSLSYAWTQTDGPEVTLNNADSVNPTFVSPQVEQETQLTFQLIVSTDSATSDPDSVTIIVTRPLEPQTPDTNEPQTPDTNEPLPLEYQTILDNCNDRDDTSAVQTGSLTLKTNSDFSQVYQITPNPYNENQSLYFVNNDFFDCDIDPSTITLSGLEFGWYKIEVWDQLNPANYKTFDISLNRNLTTPTIYLFERSFTPNLYFEPIPSQYIVWLNENITTDSETVSDEYSINGNIKFVFQDPPGFVINTNGTSNENEKMFIDKLTKDPRILAINQDLNGKIASLRYNNQTVPDGLERINANILNFTGIHSNNTVRNSSSNLDFSNVDIAILDTGISLTHPDLNVYKNVSFIDGVDNGNDDLGHGTHIAGIAAAKDNAQGILGVAPGAKLWAIKVCDKDGNCPVSSQVKAIQYLNDHANEIDIVNLSIENPPSSKLDKAVNNSLSKGLIYVVAAGNSNQSVALTSPARVPGVISVSAISDSDGKCGGKGNQTFAGNDDYAAFFSNYGKSIDFAAPGVNIFSTYLNDGYAFDSGTSMAAPFVAGQAAVYKSYHPNATSSEIVDSLVNSSIPYLTSCDGQSHGHFLDLKNLHEEPLIYSVPMN
ncbi:MAG TPA: S8 family serine peptidase [Candidatus Nitrosocosmicus sp.]|nr:S8 family serine peptidase [Candidatus Nitrosocosmicus sp.]